MEMALDRLSTNETANEVMVRKAYDAVNEKQIHLLKDFFTTDFACHFTPTQTRVGLDPQKSDLEILFKAFPDYHVAIDDVVSQGDKVAVRLTVSGTHLGDFYGKPPTGKTVSWPAMEIFRSKDGKFAEQWIVSDTLNLQMQLSSPPAQR
jgi:predicted ester cyclase